MTTEPALDIGTPQVVYEGPFVTPPGQPDSQWDVTADGRRLLIMQSENSDEATEAAEPAPPQINIVLNWFEELKQQAPVE